MCNHQSTENNSMNVRTRIAPSPTGDPHVGTAYVALFNLAFARRHGGQFILRIEDTDQVRSTPESEQAILQSLRWLGLEWDEGPDISGPYGPYRQSERCDIYRQYALQLVESGHAFYCFATPAELNELRCYQAQNNLPIGYDGRGLQLEQTEIERRLAAGEPYVIRLKVPVAGTCMVEDMLRGSIAIDWSQVDMQVLLKADGMPTYHLANVVDDHLMGITHVIRGEEWINSAPKHMLLYQYLGWQMPALCHLPLLRNPDKSKLSKRKNPTGILYYQRMGYLPEALLNYLARMGWSMPDEQEKFSLKDMLAVFDLQRVSLGGPIFDQQKLSWLNGLWLREELTDAQYVQRVQDWALNTDYLAPLVPLIRPRVDKFSDIVPLAGFFLAGMLELSSADFVHKHLQPDQVRKVLQFSVWRLESVRDWHKDRIFAVLNQLAQAMQIKPRDLFASLFIAITGSTNSVSVFDAMAHLGPDISRARLRHGVNVLGGLSNKEAKRWDKEYRQLAML
jgi:glutamyl-tRNA synthetase